MNNQLSMKIPFRVSARTARLIGRENIATAKGAIIELVKNGYDADSDLCIVYFDNYFSVFHKELHENDYNTLKSRGVSECLLNDIYILNEDSIYVSRDDVTEEQIQNLKKATSKLSSIYVIDEGEGMTLNVITDSWMTIGTDNKAIKYFTKRGRVKAGAKGIGRFALDKLGSKCEMTTVFNPEYSNEQEGYAQIQNSVNGYKWFVNWEDFEGEFKTIEKVNADLVELRDNNLRYYINDIHFPKELLDLVAKYEFEYGTILKISDLRENWEDFYVDQVYSDLEVLVPPKENNEFNIFVSSSLEQKKYGEVISSICDDYDYKIIASADENQNVNITIHRNEYDLDLVPNEFFKRTMLQQNPFTENDFKKGYWKTTRTFSQLIPGFKSIDEEDTFGSIGVFEFTFYFLKKTYTSDDAARFFYRGIKANDRKDWLDKFGGIKLFRDNFRVRPYGEKKDVAFDWLGLGARKAQSPAGIAKPEGGYKVEPENVAGSIKISRLTNVDFEDKSSREGLQENKTFQLFKILISSIIEMFEKDRAFIAREMNAYDNERYGEIRDKLAAEELARKILNQQREKERNKSSENKTNDFSQQSQEDDEKDRTLAIIARLNEQKEEELEKMREEQKVLRVLASSGLVLASFSHDLSKHNNLLEGRFDNLVDLLANKISDRDYICVEDRKNPFIQIDKMRKDDENMQNWLKFSLGVTRKDKRKRRQLALKSYFQNLAGTWQSIFDVRGIIFDIEDIEEVEMRAFEIDFDSIFHNLLVNTIDAFNISKENREREIKIVVYENDKEIVIEYHDNGPGLSKDITNPNDIFKPLFTTKRSKQTGEEIGTGLGMWLVESIVKENDGKVKILFPPFGFGLRVIFPIKYKR